MKTHPLYALFVCLCCVLSLPGCKQKESPDTREAFIEEPEGPTQILVLGGEKSPMWLSFAAGLRQAARGYPEWSFTWNQDGEEVTLKSQKETLSALNPEIDAVIFDPIDVPALELTLKNLAEKQVVLLTPSQVLTSRGPVPYLAPSPDSAGVAAATLLAEAVGGEGSLAVIRQEGSATDSLLGYFQKTLSEHYPGVTLLETQNYPAPNLESAYRQAETLLLMNPQTKGIFCTDPDATEGALKALKDIGQAGQVKIVGAGFRTSLELPLGEGEVEALILDDPWALADKSLALLRQILAGSDSLPPIPMPQRVLQRDNIHSPGSQALLQAYQISPPQGEP